MRPKEERERIAIGRLLDYYNVRNNASFELSNCEWLDRYGGSGLATGKPTPDCICRDKSNGNEIVIERTMLVGEQDPKLFQGAVEFLDRVREQLTCQLPGVFHLHDWEDNCIIFTASNRQEKIDQLSKAILAAAHSLAEGEEVRLTTPFPVKLTREKGSKTKVSCGIVFSYPDCEFSGRRSQPGRSLVKVLNEADKKFASYSGMKTVLLINIWETETNYQEFKSEYFEMIDMEKYLNIRSIYLSEGEPDPPIYHLWSRSDENREP